MTGWEGPGELSNLRTTIHGLLADGLHTSAEIVAGVLVSRVSVAPPDSPLGDLHAEALELFADALRGRGEHKRALAFIKQALTQRKLGPKKLHSRSGTPRHSPINLSSASSGVDLSGDRCAATAAATGRDGGGGGFGSSSSVGLGGGGDGGAPLVAGMPAAAPWQRTYLQEAALRFKEACCLRECGDASAAITALEGVLLFARTAEMNVCLAGTYESAGLKRNAASTYKVALRQNVFALEAIPPLLALSGGADKAEIWDIIRGGLHALPGAPTLDDLPWLECFVEGHAAACANQYQVALQHFVELERWCPNNVHALLYVGKARCDLDQWDEAQQAFAKARMADQRCMDMMDWYAASVSEVARRMVAPTFRAVTALNRLTHELLEVDCRRPEPWVSVALLCQQRGQCEAGLPFVDKALELRPRYALALFVRGQLLMALNRPDQAQIAFHQGNALVKDIHSYTGLVDAAIACSKLKEAVALAREAVAAMPSNNVAYTILGNALLNAGDMVEAEAALKRALLLDPASIPAATLLADCYTSTKRAALSVDLLQNMTWTTHSDALYCKLASVYERSGRFNDALTYYHMAISLNPNNLDATAGLEELEKQMRSADGDDGPSSPAS